MASFSIETAYLGAAPAEAQHERDGAMAPAAVPLSPPRGSTEAPMTGGASRSPLTPAYPLGLKSPALPTTPPWSGEGSRGPKRAGGSAGAERHASSKVAPLGAVAADVSARVAERLAASAHAHASVSPRPTRPTASIPRPRLAPTLARRAAESAAAAASVGASSGTPQRPLHASDASPGRSPGLRLNLGRAGSLSLPSVRPVSEGHGGTPMRALLGGMSPLVTAGAASDARGGASPSSLSSSPSVSGPGVASAGGGSRSALRSTSSAATGLSASPSGSVASRGTSALSTGPRSGSRHRRGGGTSGAEGAGTGASAWYGVRSPRAPLSPAQEARVRAGVDVVVPSPIGAGIATSPFGDAPARPGSRRTMVVHLPASSSGGDGLDSPDSLGVPLSIVTGDAASGDGGGAGPQPASPHAHFAPPGGTAGSPRPGAPVQLGSPGPSPFSPTQTPSPPRGAAPIARGVFRPMGNGIMRPPQLVIGSDDSAASSAPATTQPLPRHTRRVGGGVGGGASGARDADADVVSVSVSRITTLQGASGWRAPHSPLATSAAHAVAAGALPSPRDSFAAGGGGSRGGSGGGAGGGSGDAVGLGDLDEWAAADSMAGLRLGHSAGSGRSGRSGGGGGASLSVYGEWGDSVSVAESGGGGASVDGDSTPDASSLFLAVPMFVHHDDDGVESALREIIAAKHRANAERAQAEADALEAGARQWWAEAGARPRSARHERPWNGSPNTDSVEGLLATAPAPALEDSVWSDTTTERRRRERLGSPRNADWMSPRDFADTDRHLTRFPPADTSLSALGASGRRTLLTQVARNLDTVQAQAQRVAAVKPQTARVDAEKCGLESAARQFEAALA